MLPSMDHKSQFGVEHFQGSNLSADMIDERESGQFCVHICLILFFCFGLFCYSHDYSLTFDYMFIVSFQDKQGQTSFKTCLSNAPKTIHSVMFSSEWFIWHGTVQGI